MVKLHIFYNQTNPEKNFHCWILECKWLMVFWQRVNRQKLPFFHHPLTVERKHSLRHQRLILPHVYFVDSKNTTWWLRCKSIKRKTPLSHAYKRKKKINAEKQDFIARDVKSHSTTKRNATKDTMFIHFSDQIRHSYIYILVFIAVKHWNFYFKW